MSVDYNRLQLQHLMVSVLIDKDYWPHYEYEQIQLEDNRYKTHIGIFREKRRVI